MSERITWTQGKYASEEGRAGGLHLFTVGYGTKRQDAMYYLETSLPVRHSSIGQHYPTPTHAKVAAERLLSAFIAKVDPARDATQPDAAAVGAGEEKR